MYLAIVIFVVTYLLISLGENSPRKLDRPTAALLGAVLMVMTGALTRHEAAVALDLSTLAVLFGMMVLLAVLGQSGLPTWLALKALNRCRNPHVLLAFVVFSSGIASAVMLNDTVCLLATPLLLEMTAAAGIPATPFLLALATSTNIGSVMTLTGNPQNIIIGHASGWGWSAFALRMVPIGLICLTMNWLMLEILYRRSLATAVLQWKQTVAPKGAVQQGLAVKSVCAFGGLIMAFLIGAPMDVAALAAAMVLLIWANRPPRAALKAVDWSLLLFFAGLFVVVQGFVKADRELLNTWINHIGTEVRFASIAQISCATIIGSNLFSNVPFVLIASHWVAQMSNPKFVWLLLALTSTFAGNLTLFGSVANVIVAQGAQQKAPLRFTDFLWAGVPITIITTAVGVFMLWALLAWGWV
jgi:Na+/H+ antiporter NhaD/arsenite permease-like protein